MQINQLTYLFRHLLQVVAPRHKQPSYLCACPKCFKGPPSPGSLGKRDMRKRLHAPPLGRAGDARPQTLPSRSAVSYPAWSRQESATRLRYSKRGRIRAGSIPGLSSLTVPCVQQRVAQDCAVAALREPPAVSEISLVASSGGQPPQRSASVLQLTFTTQQLQPSSTAKAQRAQ